MWFEPWPSRCRQFRKLLEQIEASVPNGVGVHLVMDNHATHKTKPIRDWDRVPPSGVGAVLVGSVGCSVSLPKPAC
jgi:hypothetical protein